MKLSGLTKAKNILGKPQKSNFFSGWTTKRSDHYKKKDFFLKFEKKRMTPKLGGGGVRVLLVRPLKIFFFAVSLRISEDRGCRGHR